MKQIVYRLVIGIGIAVWLYPQLFIFENDFQNLKNINIYQNNAARNERELKKIYDQHQRIKSDAQRTTDPFSTNSLSNSLFSPTSLIIGFLTIPDINENLPIFSGTSEEELAAGVGVIANTSLPTGGIGTHAALAGHRGYSKWRMFRYLDDLQNDSLIYVHINSQILIYSVYEKEVIRPTNFEKLAAVPNQDLLTLVTCHPLNSNKQRLLVRAKRIEKKRELENKENQEAGIQGGEQKSHNRLTYLFTTMMGPYQRLNRWSLLVGLLYFLFLISSILFKVYNVWIKNKKNR